MNARLTYMIVQYRSAELRRAGERARLATEMRRRRRSLREQNTITGPGAEPCGGAAAFKAKRALWGAR
jgi:hypothetical protein